MNNQHITTNPNHRAPRRSPKDGVIAALFLAVVAFIFGAISFSMQTGQIIERRIKTDFAAEASVFAMASHNSQGLNYIASNNLAIAGAVHMSGSVHIAADIMAIIWTIPTSDKMDVFKQSNISMGTGSGSTHDDEMTEKYHKICYSYLMYAAKIFTNSAVGMTKLNTFLSNGYAVLGVPRAIEVGGANAPGAFVIPVNSSGLVRSTSNTSLKDVGTKLLTFLSTAITSIKYPLVRLRADESFCLPFEASAKTGDSDRHNPAKWLASMTTSAPQIVQDAATATIAITNAVTTLGSWIGFNIGFAGCGFGAPTDGFGVQLDTSKDGSRVAPLLALALRGPLSGRESAYPGCVATPAEPATPAVTCPPPAPEQIWPRFMGQDQSTLAVSPNNTAPSPSWTAGDEQVVTIGNPSPHLMFKIQDHLGQAGACVWMKSDTSGYATDELPKVSDGHGHQVKGKVQLNNLNFANIDEVLFKWGGFGGRESSTNSATGNVLTSSPPPFGGRTPTMTEDLCPPFPTRVGEVQGRDLIWDPKIKITLQDPVLAPILGRLTFTTPAEPLLDPPLNGRAVYETVITIMDCARINKRVQSKNPDNSLNYFTPNMDHLDFLCPVQENLKFLATDPLPHGYEGVRDWHNNRVDQMNCGPDYQKLMTGKDLKCETPPPQTQAQSTRASDESFDFCEPGAHMCWQKGLQKQYTDYKTVDKTSPLAFLVPKLTESSYSAQLSPLETYLRYAVFLQNPIYTDAVGQINGRRDGSALSHCPPYMDAQAKVGTNTVDVCDVTPMVGLLNRAIASGSDINAKESFGAGSDSSTGVGGTNLASGGSLAFEQSGGLPHMYAIAEARVVYDPATTDPQKPTAAAGVADSKSKAYQMFWPAWKARIVPSRVISKMMPAAISPLMED
jgi:hypothetical protein